MFQSNLTPAQEQQFKRGDTRLTQAACLMHHLSRWGEDVPEISATALASAQNASVHAATIPTDAADKEYESEVSEEEDEELRQDVDGEWYTRTEFFDYYGSGYVVTQDTASLTHSHVVGNHLRRHSRNSSSLICAH